MKWLRYIPATLWLAHYRAAWLGGDIAAGVTLAAYAIPVSLAYASLAGLPPQVGIYGYLLGGIGYALLQARIGALRQGLNQLGWVEGKNLAIEYRCADIFVLLGCWLGTCRPALLRGHRNGSEAASFRIAKDGTPRIPQSVDIRRCN